MHIGHVPCTCCMCVYVRPLAQYSMRSGQISAALTRRPTRDKRSAIMYVSRTVDPGGEGAGTHRDLTPRTARARASSRPGGSGLTRVARLPHAPSHPGGSDLTGHRRDRTYSSAWRPFPRTARVRSEREAKPHWPRRFGSQVSGSRDTPGRRSGHLGRARSAAHSPPAQGRWPRRRLARRAASRPGGSARPAPTIHR